jgi:hypothetical protein
LAAQKKQTGDRHKPRIGDRHKARIGTVRLGEAFPPALRDAIRAAADNLGRKRGEPVTMRVAYGEALLDFVEKHGVKIPPQLRAKVRGLDC